MTSDVTERDGQVPGAQRRGEALAGAMASSRRDVGAMQTTRGRQ